MRIMDRKHRPPRIFAAILLLVGLALFALGVRLVIVGGSFYYVLAGAAIVASGALLWSGDRLGSTIYGWMLLATLAWGLFEVGTDLWALAPRLVFLAVIGLGFLTPWVRRGLYSPRRPPALFSNGANKLIAAGTLLAMVVIAFLGTRVSVDAMPTRNVAGTKPAADAAADAAAAAGQWHNYGNTSHGTRYARLDQITPENAGKLKELWHYRTGHGNQFKATPLQIDDLLITCLPRNAIVALDAETGARRWEFDPHLDLHAVGGFTSTCRGVSYYRAPEGYVGDCPERILTATTSAQMFAVNAQTGERCRDFGVNGEISLLPGMGEVKPGFYFVTSPPLIARNLAVVGGWVVDNVEINEPSGVVRAYDTVTGKFTWAWDMGRPGVNTEPAEGEHYTRATPNVWSLMSYDDRLGLIYAPTGNSTPDYFGAQRIPASEKYSSSVVALDVANGAVRWSYQTVHHDIWDYDVPSQPVLIDLPQADGSIVPALVQATKRGELFLLDRRVGTPISEVQELPVPQRPVPEDWVSKTQPFSVGMPNFRTPDLTEADMWGLTPIDQLWCRIAFREMRYEGHFTPPGVSGTLQYPSSSGGFNWGGVSVDEENQLLVANPLIMSSRQTLIPRDQVPSDLRGGMQAGTPYAVRTQRFMSPLAVPCQKPPYGRIAVIDLQTRKFLWNKPLGTTNESGPFGMRMRLPLPMGVPQSAGTLVTKGGVIFVGGSMDRYFRAFDLKTGKELWRDYLPVTAQATPMSYLSPRSKRQIVVLTVPSFNRTFSAQQSATPPPVVDDPLGGHIIAYALPVE